MNTDIRHFGVVAATLLLLAGCSAFEVVPPAQQSDEYVFACNKVGGQPGCETRANDVCPNGYDTLSNEEDFQRKELRVRCLGGPNAP